MARYFLGVKDTDIIAVGGPFRGRRAAQAAADAENDRAAELTEARVEVIDEAERDRRAAVAQAAAEAEAARAAGA